MDHLVAFARAQNVQGITLKPLEEPGRSPFLLVDIAAQASGSGDAEASKKTVLLYGHMDKMPYGEGWSTDPADPVIKDGLLYGRGANDDGYAFFSAILAVKACQDLGLGHPRVLITIEGSEEGEIHDLVFYIKKLKSELGKPDLVIGLDAMALNTETIFVTTTLRGILAFDLTVQTAKSNMHSGFSGPYPNSYFVMNQLLARVVNFETHEMLPEFQTEIPPFRVDETHATARLFPETDSGFLLPGVSTTAMEHQGSPDAGERFNMNLKEWW